MTPDERGWACVSSWGRCDLSSVRSTRSASIAAFMKDEPFTWRWFRSKGWRCVRVRVVEVGGGDG